MVFGHETTSHDLNLTGNNFIYAGCVQPRGDRAGIAFMCPGGHKPNGTVANNNFATCNGVPAMSDQIPNCSRFVDCAVTNCSVREEKAQQKVWGHCLFSPNQTFVWLHLGLCSEMIKTNNRIDDGLVFAEEPQISFSPPGPESGAVSHGLKAHAVHQRANGAAENVFCFFVSIL